MGCWVKFESYATGKQIGINLSGTYVYCHGDQIQWCNWYQTRWNLDRNLVEQII